MCSHLLARRQSACVWIQYRCPDLTVARLGAVRRRCRTSAPEQWRTLGSNVELRDHRTTSLPIQGGAAGRAADRAAALWAFAARGEQRSALSCNLCGARAAPGVGDAARALLFRNLAWQACAQLPGNDACDVCCLS